MLNLSIMKILKISCFRTQIQLTYMGTYIFIELWTNFSLDNQKFHMFDGWVRLNVIFKRLFIIWAFFLINFSSFQDFPKNQPQRINICSAKIVKIGRIEIIFKNFRCHVPFGSNLNFLFRAEIRQISRLIESNCQTFEELKYVEKWLL